MRTALINRTRCNLYRGIGIRHLVETVAHRLSTEMVDDAVAGMRVDRRPVKFQGVDMAVHKSRQYVACPNCFKPVTVDDVNQNECCNCGA